MQNLTTVKARSRAHYIYCAEEKQINYKFIPTELFRGRPLIKEFLMSDFLMSVGNNETGM